MSSSKNPSRLCTYRPQQFRDVIDQQAVVQTLIHTVQRKHPAAAYLFCGTRGIGKTTLARLFAKALNCLQPIDGYEPCQTCASCIEWQQGVPIDIIEIDGASHRGIDDIKILQEILTYTPHISTYRICIIDEAHMLTKEAFNALLKVLEEPPSHIRFIFATTEPTKLPLTILSRCQRFNLRRITLSSIQAKLAQIVKELDITCEEDALYHIAKLSDGSLRVAESLFDQVCAFQEGPLTTASIKQALGLASQEEFFALDLAFQAGDLSFAFSWAEALFMQGKDMIHLLYDLLEHFRHIIACHLHIPNSDLPLSLQEHYASHYTIYTQEQAFWVFDYLMTWHDTFSKVLCTKITLETILLYILRSKHRIQATDLMQRLLALQDTSIKTEPVTESLPLIAQTQEEPVVQDVIPACMHYDTLVRFAAVELEGSLSS